MKRNTNRLFVLFVSYCLVYGLQWLDRPFEFYWRDFFLSCMLIIILCVRVVEWVLIGYAICQLLLMVAYWNMMRYPSSPEAFDSAYWLIYLAPLNLSIIVHAYELFMLIFIGIGYAVHWNGFNSVSGGHNMPGDKKVNQP